MPQKPGLKRDLAAERAARKAASQQARLVPQGLPTVRPEQLMPSPENGRKKLLKIDELADSLKSDGMNTAMTVIPPEVYADFYPQHKEAVDAQVAEGILFVVHHGHRRLAAALAAGLTEVPILVRREVPSLRIAAIQENLQRMGLNPVEEAIEFQEALDEKDDNGKQLSQRELAKRAGCSQTYVSHRVALLRLIPELRQAVVNHWLKEQQLLDADSDTAGESDGILVLPVREAATVYARLTPAMQEAFVRGELTAVGAQSVSKLPAEQQALPTADDDSDCAAISDSQETRTALPEPRGGESDIKSTPAPLPPGNANAASTQSAGTGNGSGPQKQSVEPRPATPSGNTVVAAAEEPRGVIVVRSVEELALSIIDLLEPDEVEALRGHLSA
ncbi:ParB N-terminal domain-containing protein [Streptomyces sp. NBC_00687]|uniref:ParB/RepB/Spo0J family partition protein n=1 Tax=Streptomyces sp. NBC_00687 TaxID=2975807 RepID=UPI00224F0AFB|nr:ParB N-terminal domain-containing protein [Streptomyces sp. NBC_00687]MCX4919911.1 ParB N-terminal domain-containing protein [Streptomyces sp. NBC_00687]